MIDKADKILAKYEDDNEYHFHECDRAWIIGAMIEFAKGEVEKLKIHDVIKSVCDCGSAFSIHDLKCGNILNYYTAEGDILPTVIDWQDLKWLTEDPKGFNLVHSPIYLDNEWLEKLGFDKTQNETHKVRVGLDGDDFIKHQMTYQFNRQFVCKLKYVHELQNLHYSLTGEMLSLS